MMALFRRDRPPVRLAALADLPEDLPRRISTSPPLAVVRHGETVHVFEDRCPHAGAILSRGVLDGNRLTCPIHKGTFEIDTGRSVGGVACRTLRTYPTWVENGDVYMAAEPRGRRSARRAKCGGEDGV
ncbi:Rieske 2Fe-2S domain-containing protein [Streptomyces sp. SID3343]|uniref:Rieske (2Fe-2S) protein n=1 Tax=Streptomyces sp. SID3343 TaxID=2690260 RepID=UPI001370A156|nr:Rieske 2Fe-2S domain-containing protein [Streptomyces sp. SID3343]